MKPLEITPVLFNYSIVNEVTIIVRFLKNTYQVVRDLVDIMYGLQKAFFLLEDILVHNIYCQVLIRQELILIIRSHTNYHERTIH